MKHEKSLEFSSTKTKFWELLKEVRETTSKNLLHVKVMLTDLEAANTERVFGLCLRGKDGNLKHYPDQKDHSTLLDSVRETSTQLESQIRTLQNQCLRTKLKKKKIGARRGLLKKPGKHQICKKTTKLEKVSLEEIELLNKLLAADNVTIAQLDQLFEILESSHRKRYLSAEELKELEEGKEITMKNKNYLRILKKLVKGQPRRSRRKSFVNEMPSDAPIQQDVTCLEITPKDSSLTKDDEMCFEKTEDFLMSPSLTDTIVSKKSAKQPDYIKGVVFLEENLSKTLQLLGTGERGMVFLAEMEPLGLCAVKKFPIARGRFGDLGAGGSFGCSSGYGIGNFISSIFVRGTNLDEERINKEMEKRELEILSVISSHPNIIGFFGVLQRAEDHWQTKKNWSRINTGYVMEYMPGGSLEKMISDNPDYLTESRVASYSLDTAKALAFCHTKYNIAHGNIKPSKVLLTGDRKTAKLGGFGSSGSHNPYLTCRKPSIKYCAPEMINDVGVASEKYGFKADIWSYAMLIYAITFKREPFTDYSIVSSQKHRDNLLADKRPPTSDWPMREEGFKDEIMEIMKNGWKTEPGERRDMKDIVENLGKVLARV